MPVPRPLPSKSSLMMEDYVYRTTMNTSNLNRRPGGSLAGSSQAQANSSSVLNPELKSSVGRAQPFRRPVTVETLNSSLDHSTTPNRQYYHGLHSNPPLVGRSGNDRRKEHLQHRGEEKYLNVLDNNFPLIGQWPILLPILRSAFKDFGVKHTVTCCDIFKIGYHKDGKGKDGEPDPVVVWIGVIPSDLEVHIPDYKRPGGDVYCECADAIRRSIRKRWTLSGRFEVEFREAVEFRLIGANERADADPLVYLAINQHLPPGYVAPEQVERPDPAPQSTAGLLREVNGAVWGASQHDPLPRVPDPSQADLGSFRQRMLHKINTTVSHAVSVQPGVAVSLRTLAGQAYGTLGLVVLIQVPSDGPEAKFNPYFVTCRHVFIPEWERGNPHIDYRMPQTVARRVQIAPPHHFDLVYEGYLWSVEGELEEKLDRRKSEADSYYSLLVARRDEEKIKDELNRFKTWLQLCHKDTSDTGTLVIGALVYSPSKGRENYHNIYDRDIAIVQLRDTATANMVATYNVINFGLYALDNTVLGRIRAFFDLNGHPYPDNNCLKITADIIPSAEMKVSTPVIKAGASTGVTVGMANAMEGISFLRVNVGSRDNDPRCMFQYDEHFYWSILSPQANVFSESGDSGAVVADLRGRWGALLSSGVGMNQNQLDLTYATPAFAILEQLYHEAEFPRIIIP